MKKYGPTLATTLIFIGLLTWVLTRERGRVPEKEEIFKGVIAKAEDVTKLEVVKYEPATPSTSADENSNEESPDDNQQTSASENAQTSPPNATASESSNSEKKKKSEPHVKTTRVVLEKRDDEWYLVEPIQGLADPETVKTMVKSFVELKPGVRKDVNVNAEEYGLSKPKMEVTATLKNGRQVKIALGNDTPIGGKIYASISGQEGLFLVPTMFRTDMDKKPETLRDKKLARFERDDVIRVTFITEKGTVVCEKSGQTKDKKTWRIVSPGEYKADEFVISSAVSKIVDSEAKDFAPDPNNLKAYGLDKPAVQLIVQLKNGKTFEVALGAKIKKKIKPYEYSTTEEEKNLVYAMRKGRPEVLLLEDTVFTDLNKDLMALRDKRILADFKREDVMSLRADRRKGLSFSVMRSGDEWVMQTPEVGKARKTKIDDILWDLSDLEAKEYLTGTADLRQLGLAVPSTVLTLKMRNGKTIVVKFGDQVTGAAETQYYCMLGDSPQVYKVSDMLIKDLPEKVEDLKEGASSSTSSNAVSNHAD